jgi:hypothetical protein
MVGDFTKGEIRFSNPPRKSISPDSLSALDNGTEPVPQSATSAAPNRFALLIFPPASKGVTSFQVSVPRFLAVLEQLLDPAFLILAKWRI